MTAGPCCRFATIKDLAALVALENESFAGDRLTRRQWRYHLNHQRNKVWVCTDDTDHPVAALLAFFPAGRAPRLYSLATAPSWRGKGLGAALIGVFLKEAADTGAQKAILEVRQDAKGAIALYERHGFKTVRVLPGYYEDGTDGIKMQVRLPRFCDIV
ncbi:MAG: GNAT family N-acetyltransferase [Rhodospirillales bacterium]|nr:GNAT family N-acetyltransferase [Rhodospirillales bacterium]MCB9996799.1 GNAT family N-acetyltransferase [Rhodospirillales bacterium]